jgi:hypothetical protein
MVQRLNKILFLKYLNKEHLRQGCCLHVDYEKGKLNKVVLESKDQKKVTNISMDLNVIHLVEKMDLHRQTGEMLNIYVMIATLGIKKLQV